MIPIVLVGGGGHCRSLIDVIASTGKYDISGILEKPGVKEDVFSYPVIGTDEDIPSLQKDGLRFIITVGHTGDASLRRRLSSLIDVAGGVQEVIISPTAWVSPHARLGAGTVVMHHAVVNAGAVIGKGCIINSQALVEHDVVVGDQVHISTGAKINGCCRIGDGCFIGSGAVIIHETGVASDCIVGAGAVVIDDIGEPGTYAGNPCRRIVRGRRDRG